MIYWAHWRHGSHSIPLCWQHSSRLSLAEIYTQGCWWLSSSSHFCCVLRCCGSGWMQQWAAQPPAR